MPRIYKNAYNATITNAGGDVDWMDFKPASNKPIRLRGKTVSQFSEVGDAAEEEVEFRIARLAATVTDGSGGASDTPVQDDENDASAGYTARHNDTTLATSSGSTTNLDELAWNERNTPYERWFPDDEYAPRVQNAAALSDRQLNTLADDISAQVTYWVKEF